MKVKLLPWPLGADGFLKSVQDTVEIRRINGLVAHKFIMNHPLPVKKCDQHAFSNSPGACTFWRPRFPFGHPLAALHFGLRVILINPSFIHCNYLFQNSRVAPHMSQHQLGTLQALAQVVGCKQGRNQFGTPPGQVQILLQDALD